MNKKSKVVRKKHHKKRGNEGTEKLQALPREVFAACVIQKKDFPDFLGDFKESNPGQFGRMDHWEYGERTIMIIIAMPDHLKDILTSSISEGMLRKYPWEIKAQKL